MSLDSRRDRYVVISADCHAGGIKLDYSPYVPSKLEREFRGWRSLTLDRYSDASEPLVPKERYDLNVDHEQRLAELEQDGVVAEVIFPQGVPPFFDAPSFALQTPVSSAAEFDMRWVGLHSHNLWLADLCAEAPDRRAGVAQIMLDDVQRAVEEIHWARSAGLRGGIVLPGASPGLGVQPLYSPVYEPLWATCEELQMPVHVHGETGVPDYGSSPAAHTIAAFESPWWSRRVFAHLLLSGVCERYPSLQIVLTEQGTQWIPEQLRQLDYFYGRSRAASAANEHVFGDPVIGELSMTPSGYWSRQCHAGASVIRRYEVANRELLGTTRLMWGNDYPHGEGCWLFTREQLRLAFAGIEKDDVHAMVAGNAASVYGFELDKLRPIAARVGPRVDEVARPITRDDLPTDAAHRPAFADLFGFRELLQ